MHQSLLTHIRAPTPLWELVRKLLGASLMYCSAVSCSSPWTGPWPLGCHSRCDGRVENSMAQVGRWLLVALCIIVLGATSAVLLQTWYSHVVEVRQRTGLDIAESPRQGRTISRADLLVVIPTSIER